MKSSVKSKEERFDQALDELVANATLEKRLERFLLKLKTPEKLSVHDIKDIIWNEDDHHLLSRLAFFLFDGKTQEEHQGVLDILSEAWNYFPHRSLNGLSPHEMMERGGIGGDARNFSSENRQNFYEIFSNRFPKQVAVTNVGPHEWEFEFPASIQGLHGTIRELDKLEEEIRDIDESGYSALAAGLSSLMDILEMTVEQEPLFFDGAVRLARQVFAEGDTRHARRILEISIRSGQELFPKNFKVGKERLPWGRLDNRPYLLLLGEFATLVDQTDGTMKAIPLYQEIIDLNPGDNQGIRSFLATAYLKTNQLEKLCDFKKMYPEDLMQELTVGYILALLKLGRSEEARKEILRNYKYCAHVFREIQKIEHPQPPLEHGRVLVGGDDEAWLYWQAQGNLWMTTKGARKFLGEVCASVQK